MGQFLSWRWIFKLAAIGDGFMFLLLLLSMPETLYKRRDPPSTSSEENHHCATGIDTEEPEKALVGSLQRHIHRLRLRRCCFRREIHVRDFVAPMVRVARYVSLPLCERCERFN